MIKQTDKTVPYRLTQAELENLRLLRKRMNPSCSIEEDKEEKLLGKKDTWIANPIRQNQKAEKRIS